MLKIHLNTTKKIHISMNSVVGSFVILITLEFNSETIIHKKCYDRFLINRYLINNRS